MEDCIHARHTCFEETIEDTMDWKTMCRDIREHVKRCHACQHVKWQTNKHGNLATQAVLTPWK